MPTTGTTAPAPYSSQVWESQWWPSNQHGSPMNWSIDSNASGGAGLPEPIHSFKNQFDIGRQNQAWNDNKMNFSPMPLDSLCSSSQTYDVQAPLAPGVRQRPVQGYFNPAKGLWSVTDDVPAPPATRMDTFSKVPPAPPARPVPPQSTKQQVQQSNLVPPKKGSDIEHLFWDSDSDNETSQTKQLKDLKVPRSELKCSKDMAPGAHRKKEPWAILSPSPNLPPETTTAPMPLHNGTKEDASDSRVVQVIDNIPNIWCDIPTSKESKAIGDKGVGYVGGPAFVKQIFREIKGEVSLDILTSYDQKSILWQIPRSADGALTSVGSIGHRPGSFFEDCRPCIFWYKDLCKKGVQCLFCHFSHGGQKAKRIRASKKTRMRLKVRGKEDDEQPDDAVDPCTSNLDF